LLAAAAASRVLGKKLQKSKRWAIRPQGDVRVGWVVGFGRPAGKKTPFFPPPPEEG